MGLIYLRTAFLLVAAGVLTFADVLVVPNQQASTTGNVSLNNNGKAGHIQEIVGGGQFPFAGAITIYALRVRAVPGTGPVTSPKGPFKVTMSTTQAYPNTANGHALPSLTFANNFGPDATVVFNDTGTISSLGCPPPGPCPFDIVFPFAVPFTYDPAKGRLLIDLVFGAAPGALGNFDGQLFPDFTNSSVVFLVTNDPTQTVSDPIVPGGLIFGIEYAGSAPPFSFVIPRSLGTADGDSSSTASGLFGTAAVTVQFQITAAEIAALGINKGDQITGVQTRLESGQATAPAAAAQIANLDITLAEAALPFGSISNTFANNLKNPVMVRGGPFTIPANSMPGGSLPGTPNPFGVLVPFTTPYTYQGGDLIFMYTKTAVSTTMTTDAANNYTGVSTSYRNVIIAGYQATSGNLGTAIAPFQFSVTPKFGNKNSASYSPQSLAPDMIAFGETAGIAGGLTVASSNPWPFTLGNAHLDIIDGQNQTHPAPLYYVTNGAMSYLLPADTPAGQVTARLTTSTGATVTGTIKVVSVAPGIYTPTATGSGVASGLFIHVSGSNQTFGLLYNLPNLDQAPVDLGSPGDLVYLSLYGTGFRGAKAAAATVGGVIVPVAGFAATGVYQGEDVVNLGPLPQSLKGRGQVDIVINFDGKLTNTVTASIK